MQAFLLDKGVAFSNGETKPLLVKKARTFIEDNCKYECVTLAEQQGHTVVFSAPCYSDLQPIELVWAHIKGNIGRQYSVDTTLQIVLQRLETQFHRLYTNGSPPVVRMIKSCALRAQKLLDDIIMDEQMEDDDTDEDGALVDDDSENDEFYSENGSDNDAASHGDASGEDEDIASVVGI